MQFVAANAAVYRAAGFGGARGPITDGRLAAWLRDFDALAPAARRVSQMLPTAWRAHNAQFKAGFPAYASDEPVYLLVSLFGFDLCAQAWHGRECLFAGSTAL